MRRMAYFVKNNPPHLLNNPVFDPRIKIVQKTPQRWLDLIDDEQHVVARVQVGLAYRRVGGRLCSRPIACVRERVKGVP